jgi:hypothetical protein
MNRKSAEDNRWCLVDIYPKCSDELQIVDRSIGGGFFSFAVSCDSKFTGFVS